MMHRRFHAATALVTRRSSAFASHLTLRNATTSSPSSPPLRVLFFGTDNISLATLKRLHANMIGQSKATQPPLIQDIEIICPPDKHMGKARHKAPVPVKAFALEHNLVVHHIPDNVKSLKDWAMPPSAAPFDIGVVVSFGYFIHPHMLANVKHGAINMHPSLLPKYRGPAPIPRALLHGDTTTGISVIEIDPLAFDVGRILLQKELPIPPTSTYHSLSAHLAEEGAECVVQVLQDLDEKKKHAVVQDHAVATTAPKIKREHGIVTWNEPRDQLYNMWRAVGETVGVMCAFASKSVMLIEMHVPSVADVAAMETHMATWTSPPRLDQVDAGSFFYDRFYNALWVRTADTKWVVVTKVQPAGRKVFTPADFANQNKLHPRTQYEFDAVLKE